MDEHLILAQLKKEAIRVAKRRALVISAILGAMTSFCGMIDLMNMLNSKLKIRGAVTLMVAVMAVGHFGCRTTSGGSAVRDDSSAERRPPVLPNELGHDITSPWGGENSAKWRPEAIIANAVSRALNAGWSLDHVADVLVSVPGKFEGGWPHPYDDGQSNAMMHFSAWSAPRPPIVAALVRFKDGSSQVNFRIDRALFPQGTYLELAYRSDGNFTRLQLPTAVDPGGDKLARWSGIPSNINWDSISDAGLVFIRPGPGYGDWFPIGFRMPIYSISKLIDGLPIAERIFSDGRALIDAENLKQLAPTDPTPFERAMSHSFVGRYNLDRNGDPYVPDFVHGQFRQSDGRPVTAVGKGFTWVSQKGEPFKILYTCFEHRRPSGSGTSTSPNFDEGNAPDGGVVSGGGWHSIGEVNANRPDWHASETIINSLEIVPIVVASGFESPAERSNLPLPDHGYSYGLQDIATVRWLWPGEAFVTVSSTHKKNFHWFFFAFDREVCTEEWVYPCARATGNSVLKCE